MFTRGIHVAAAVIAIGISSVLAEVTFTKVIATGDPAPSLSNVTIDSIVPATVNVGDGSLIGFKATLAGEGVNSSNNSAYFSGPTSALNLVVRQGGALPGYAGATWDFIAGNTVMNKAGQIAMLGKLNGGPTPGIVNLVKNGDVWSTAARQGDAAPDTAVAYDLFYYPLTLNDVGEVSFMSRLTGGPQYPFVGLFTGPAGAVHVAAQTGAQVPLQPAGATFGNYIPTYGTFLSGGVGITVNVDGALAVYAGKPGTFRIAALQGAPANGMPTGTNYGGFSSQPALNVSSEVAFVSGLYGGPAGSATSALYIGPMTNPQPVLTNLGAVPGVPGATFTNFEQPILTDGGQIIFHGRFTGVEVTSGVNDTALFAGDPGNLRLVAREGTPAPDIGGLFTHIEGPLRGGYGQLVWNDVGQIAFAAHVGPGDDHHIFATLPNGELTSVVRDGQSINMDGINRYVTEARIIGNQLQGHGRIFSDNGDLAVLLNFDDGSSAIYMARVPEPAVVVGGPFLAMLYLWGAKRRHR